MALLAAPPAFANPDGAPWGSADPDTLQSCASCHFDHEPIGRSLSIVLSGLPEYLSPGEAYDLVLRFSAERGATAGFLLSASSGSFHPLDSETQGNGAEIRSVKPAVANAVVEWLFQWRAGEEADGLVVFRAAANAANDDASAFGDEIHFRKVEAQLVRDQ